jgi:D-sedoheptulose 7-phosphate isomerase
VELKKRVLRDRHLVARIVQVMAEAIRQGHKIILFGNGGSATDAQHIAAELVGRHKRERPVWPALTLTVNTSCLTAIGNDYSFDRVFSRQVDALAFHGDAAVGTSTGGNSLNVLRGVDAARARGPVSVGLAGDGGKQKSIVDYCVYFPCLKAALTLGLF